MAGTCVQTYEYNAYSGVHHLKMAFVADGSDGSFPSTATAPSKGDSAINGYVFMVIVDEGATEFTDTDTGVTLKNSAGIDIMGAVLASLTGDIQKAPELASANNYIGEVYVDGNLTVAITGNAVNSATVDIHIYWRNF